ncbi:Senescence regulator S40 [Senna tora]|uniref:Senescence regulator S40 n=1 Tax=Senna tora TaxID=362788 RepID=A0A834W022_9FABA|nr:Senescence regulator S40 [Senna tora]
MASRKGFLPKPSYIFGGTTSHTHFNPNSREGSSELDEADVWNFTTNATNPEKVTVTEGSKSGSSVCGSLPVNIPEWTNTNNNMLKEDSGENWKRDEYDDDDEEDGRIKIPPHEYLARSRGAPFSVQEGIGRTLKALTSKDMNEAS